MPVLTNSRLVMPSTAGYKLTSSCNEIEERKNFPLMSSFVPKQVNQVEKC